MSITIEQRRQHRLMTAARYAENADTVGAPVPVRRMRFRPAHCVIHVDQRCGIARFRRHAKVECDHDHAAFRERLVGARIARAILFAPCAPVQIDHHRKRPRTARLVDACKQRLVAVPQVFDIGHIDFVTGQCGGRHGGSSNRERHSTANRPPRSMRQSLRS